MRILAYMMDHPSDDPAWCPVNAMTRGFVPGGERRAQQPAALRHPACPTNCMPCKLHVLQKFFRRD